MDSAKNVLNSIVLATRHVQNALTRYSTSSGVRRIRQHSLIRLESDFQAIVEASRAIQKVLDDPTLRRQYMLDDRLVDWLSGPEPETCLGALKEMERLLKIDHEVHAFSGFSPTRTGYQEVDIDRVVTLFYSHDAHFHFLLTTDIWNCEKVVLQKTNLSNGTKYCPLIPNDGGDKLEEGERQSKPTSMNDTAASRQRKEITSQKLNKLLGILDALDCSCKHQETSLVRQPDTCLWLPATDVYKSWREGRDTFLWLQGKAGAGKSVLASSVINDLDITKKEGELLIYFYCDFRTKRSTSSVEVMRSLLAQLTEQLYGIMSDPEALLDELLKAAESRVDPFYSAKGLAHYLAKVARLCPRKPLIVVDALDECREVLALLDGLIACNRDVRIFVTTRPLLCIVKILSDLPCISMDNMTSELSGDILLHVTRELDSRSRLRTFDRRLKDEIQSQLCAKADGMFRWVQCQIDTLDRCTSVSEIRRVLKSLPEGLEETYRRILIAIDRSLSDARLVRRALVWLVAAVRPMRLHELQEGLMIDPIWRSLDTRFSLISGADFLEVSRSLVIHHKETDIVTLSHMSVKEYLLGELVQAKLPRYHVILEDAHELLARLCMAYIVFCLEEMRECRHRSSNTTRKQDPMLLVSHASRPLLRYVLADGFSHLAHVGSGNTGIFKDIEALQIEISRHAWEWDRIHTLVPSVRSEARLPSSEHDFMMYTLVAFASDALFSAFLCRPVFTQKEGSNPLVYAVHFGKTRHACALISRGANVNQPGLVVDGSACSDVCSDGSDTDSEESSIADYTSECKAMPIQVAVERWDVEMLDLLLAHGSAIPDELLTHVLRVHPHRFPLYIIRRLLQSVRFVEWAAAPWDNQQLLEAVVEDVEDYEQINSGDESMLVIEALVQAGCMATLLLVAIEKGCISIIMTLLSMASVPYSDNPLEPHRHVMSTLAANGDTPLHVAMKLRDENQCLTIMKLLVDAGFSPSELDANDKPPIHIAVVRGFVSVVEYLLSFGVHLPSRILFAALQTTLVKRVEMIRLLVSRGANVLILNHDGDSLLHLVMRSLDRSVCLEIAKVVIDVGCNPTSVNLRDETPLHIAAKQGYHEIVNYLVLFSSPPDVSSFLHNDLTMRTFIGNTDGFRFRPEEEETVFQAIRQFINEQGACLESAKIFVGAASDLFVRSAASAALLEIAVRGGFEKVVEYLVSQAVPLPSVVLFTALQYQPSMIPLLVRCGGDVHVCQDGYTLLHTAMSTLGDTECLTVTQIFVEAGCNPFTHDNTNRQPIHIAMSRALLSVVEYLLTHASKSKTSLPPDLIASALQCSSQSSMIQLLCAHSVNLSYVAPNGDHLLHIAIESALSDANCLIAVELLCEAGCSVSTPNARRKSLPILVAVRRGFPSVVEYLLSRNAAYPPDVLFTVLETIDTPPGLSRIVSLFVQHGADVRDTTANGDTLLHVALERIWDTSRLLLIVNVLIRAGCDVHTRGADGRTALQLATATRSSMVVEWIELASRRSRPALDTANDPC